MQYTVGEMAKLLDIPASTLRYYDREGLLPFVGRFAGGVGVQGTHEELMKQNGRYTRRVKLQTESAQWKLNTN